MIARLHQGEQRCNGRHATRKGMAACPPFQGGDVLFQCIARGIGQARIFMPLVMPNRLLLVCGSEIDGNVDRTCKGIGRLSTPAREEVLPLDGASLAASRKDVACPLSLTRTTFAGIPTETTCGITSLVATAIVPSIASSPILMPARTVA